MRQEMAFTFPISLYCNFIYSCHEHQIAYLPLTQVRHHRNPPRLLVQRDEEGTSALTYGAMLPPAAVA